MSFSLAYEAPGQRDPVEDAHPISPGSVPAQGLPFDHCNAGLYTEASGPFQQIAQRLDEWPRVETPPTPVNPNFETENALHLQLYADSMRCLPDYIGQPSTFTERAWMPVPFQDTTSWSLPFQNEEEAMAWREWRRQMWHRQAEMAWQEDEWRLEMLKQREEPRQELVWHEFVHVNPADPDNATEASEDETEDSMSEEEESVVEEEESKTEEVRSGEEQA